MCTQGLGALGNAEVRTRTAEAFHASAVLCELKCKHLLHDTWFGLIQNQETRLHKVLQFTQAPNPYNLLSTRRIYQDESG